MAYFKPGTSEAQITAFVSDQDGIEQRHQRSGQFGLIPFSFAPDYANHLIRIIMFATSTDADIAAFKAQLLADPRVDHLA